jgi:hypothetical protein
VKKSRNTTIAPASGIGTCSSKGVRPVPREKSSCLVLFDQVGSNLRFPEDKGRRERSRLLYFNKILDISINISDVFLLLSDLPIFVNPGPASSRRGGLFRGLCNLMILNFRLSWKASYSQFFSRHRSDSALTRAT